MRPTLMYDYPPCQTCSEVVCYYNCDKSFHLQILHVQSATLFNALSCTPGLQGTLAQGHQNQNVELLKLCITSNPELI